MKRNAILMGLGAMVLVALFLALGNRTATTVSADPSTMSWDVYMKHTLAPVLPALCTSNNPDDVIRPGECPDIYANFWLQQEGNAAGWKEATQAYFDLSNATWSTGPLAAVPADVTGDTIPDPVAGLVANHPAILGARAGAITFQVSSGLNLGIVIPANNIDDYNVGIDPTVNGQPLACDRNLVPLGQEANVLFSADLELWNAVKDDTTMVNGTLSGLVDVVNLDATTPFESQEPSNGQNGSPVYPAGCGVAGQPKCAPRGVTQLPMPIPSIVNALGLPPQATLVSRFFGIAPIPIVAATSNDVDVNFLVFSMQPVGENRYFELITVQYPTWPSVASNDPNFNILTTTVKTCPPYYAVPVFIQGVTSVPTYPDTLANPSPGTATLPGFVPEVVRTVVGGSNTGPWDYALQKSTAPDVDGDTIPGGTKGTMGGDDRCNVDTTGTAADDTDGDTLTGVCDPDHETPTSDLQDNCVSGAAGNRNVPPFSKFQDRDCDGYLNFVDNCPLVKNGLLADANVQLDTDGDGLGDSCDPEPTIPGNGQGYKTPPPKLATNGYVDNSNICNNRFFVGSTVPKAEAGDPFMKYCLAPEATNATTTPYANPALASARLSGYRDSNNDGGPDFWDGFTSAAPAAAGKTFFDYFDTKDTDGDLASNGCETFLGTDALDKTSTPGLPSLPGDCNGDTVSDVTSIATGVNPIALATPPTIDSGTATGVTATTLTDGSKSWTTNAWAGFIGKMGGSSMAITSNTGTVLTGSAWTPSMPVAGAYTIVPGAFNTSGDGYCTDAEMIALGLDPTQWYAHYNVPVPAYKDIVGPNGTRSGAVSIADVLAVLYYSGANHLGPVNGNGVAYDVDKNSDGILDGRDYDRTPGVTPGPPNGSIDISDVLGALAWSGKNCGTKGVK